jgi:hypothetical protein
MIPNQNNKIVKGMIFAGCSFTWGQGLYYYSNLLSLREPPPDQYNPDFVQATHLRFAETIRSPRLVAQHFNSFELVHPQNGGSNEGAVNWWKNCFNFSSNNKHNHYPIYKIEKSDISHVIFQLTQWQRDNFFFEIDGKQFNIPFHATNQDENRDYFIKYLESRKISLSTWIEEYIQTGFDNVKSFLQDCENSGIKTYVYTWPGDYVNHIRKDSWMNDRFITFKYKDIEYLSIEDLMGPGTMQRKVYNPELTIKWDEDEFKETPKDHHPSPKCHRVIADSIINRIEQDNNE